jgi:arylsulfatase A-like enzyme
MHLKSIILILFITTLSFSQDNLKKPNVLLLYMDDLRPELNSYGANHIHSQNIDKLAKRGVQFNEAYANVAVCGASRASMLTGIYPGRNYFIDYKTRTDVEKKDIVSLPKHLKNNGYTTISNGKIYHFLDDKWEDWDEVWRPYAFEGPEEIKPIDWWESLWKDYQTNENKDLEKSTGKGPAFEKAIVEDSVLIDGLLANKVIRDIKRLKNESSPFFLTAGFISNHLPFIAPKRFWDMYDYESINLPTNDSPPVNSPSISISNNGELINGYLGIPKKGDLSEGLSKKLMHGYYATVSYVDHLVGKIINTLEEEELSENTIVIFVSDHGFNLKEHSQWGKYTSHRISGRVPLIIYDPRTKSSANSNSLVELVDIYPTVLELLGLESPDHVLEGKSLVNILKNPKYVNKSHVFMKNAKGYTIKTADFSYTEYLKLKDNRQFIDNMLFDHNNDTDETINLSKDIKYKNVVDSLKTLLYSKYRFNIYGL